MFFSWDFKIILIYLLVVKEGMHALHRSHSVCVVRQQLAEVAFLPLPHGSQGISSDHQSQQQLLLSHPVNPLVRFFSFRIYSMLTKLSFRLFY